VYAKTKKKKTLKEFEILPICSKKRVFEKIVLEEIFEIYMLSWLSNYNAIFFYDSIEIASNDAVSEEALSCTDFK
jgi:hypothetical protein